MKIAQFRFEPSSAKWLLFYPDRNEKWHAYLDGTSSKNIDKLIEEVDMIRREFSGDEKA